MSISILSKVWEVVNAIDTEQISPVVDSGAGPLFVLNTSQKAFGNLLYTIFDRDTMFPVASYQVRYSNAHIIAQVLREPMPSRGKLEQIVDMTIPDVDMPVWDPSLVPGCYRAYPTKIG